MADCGHTVLVVLDAVDEALLGALAAERGLTPVELAGVLLSDTLQGIGDAALEGDDEQSH